MGKVKFDISVSLDGYVAGPDASLEQPLGVGGEGLHEWVVAQKSWREAHGREGGEEGTDSEIMEEQMAGTGAAVLGRRMFSGGQGPWEDDPRADGWWGEEPPFRVPAFIVTHHPREPVEKKGGTTFHFVTEGPEAALERAREAAGGEDVAIGGGASVAGQLLGAGLVDEMQLHVVPVLLGGGVRLFDGLGANDVKLEVDRVIDSPGVTHVRYRVLKP